MCWHYIYGNNICHCKEGSYSSSNLGKEVCALDFFLLRKVSKMFFLPRNGNTNMAAALEAKSPTEGRLGNSLVDESSILAKER